MNKIFNLIQDTRIDANDYTRDVVKMFAINFIFNFSSIYYYCVHVTAIIFIHYLLSRKRFMHLYNVACCMTAFTTNTTIPTSRILICQIYRFKITELQI